MDRRKGWIALVVGLTVVMTAGRADAQPAERELEVVLKGKKTLRRGTFKSMGAHKVSIAGRREVPVADVAARLFADHAQLSGELRKARKGLRADPVETDEVVELEDATVLTTSTSISVIDADAVRAASPAFAAVRGKADRKVALAGLAPKARAALTAYRAEAAQLAADHPLRAAAAAGDQALLDALAAGLGDVTITTTVVIPKKPLAVGADGRIVAPRTRGDGSFDFGASKMGSAADEVAGDKARETKSGRRDEAPAPRVKEKGKSRHQADFVTGFTRGDAWEWSRRWDVPTGFFRVKATAWYEYGLRVPVSIDGTMSPTVIESKGGDDVESTYQVELGARAVDGAAKHYTDAGIAAAHVHGGRELVLGAGFQVTLTLKVMGFDIDRRLPGDGRIDFSQDFRPPFGDCGTRCGFDVWIPADVTRTGFSLLGVIKGSARAGVNVSGDGKVFATYEALYGNDVVPSWPAGKARQQQRRHELVFDSAKQAVVMEQKLSPLSGADRSRSFGYRLSRPRYEWKVALTPGLRADIHVNAKPIFSDHITIGPLWLDDLALRLGTVNLRAHEGSRDEIGVRHGEKSHQR